MRFLSVLFFHQIDPPLPLKDFNKYFLSKYFMIFIIKELLPKWTGQKIIF